MLLRRRTGDEPIAPGPFRERGTHQSHVGPICRRGNPLAYHFIRGNEVTRAAREIAIRCGADGSTCFRVRIA